MKRRRILNDGAARSVASKTAWLAVEAPGRIDLVVREARRQAAGIPAQRSGRSLAWQPGFSFVVLDIGAPFLASWDEEADLTPMKIRGILTIKADRRDPQAQRRGRAGDSLHAESAQVL